MGRVKTFGKYILLLIAFYIVSNVLVYFCLQTSYSPMEKEIYNNDEIEVNISSAKATFIDGKVEGSVKNKTAEDLNNKYLKCEFFSKRGTLILTKYIKIDELKAGEEKNLDFNFRAENIKKLKIEVTDEYQDNENTKLINIVGQATKENKLEALIAIFILMKCFL